MAREITRSPKKWNGKSSKSTGFTLVELLVGLILTVFIGAIAITYMVSSSKSFRVQTNDALAQENARFALELLAQHVRLAGLNPNNDFEQSLDVVYNGSNCKAADEASNIDTDNTRCTVDTLANGSDRFAVDYLALVDMIGCNGAAVVVPSGSKRLANVFWTADLDNDGVRSLYCQTIDVDESDVVGAAAPLIDGVDAMQVQYGVDYQTAAFPDGDGYIDRYVSYTNLINGASNLQDRTRQVRAIRVGLLVNSGAIDGQAETELLDSRDYDLLDGPTISIADDRVARQIYSTTIAVPNSL